MGTVLNSTDDCSTTVLFQVENGADRTGSAIRNGLLDAFSGAPKQTLK
jgi:hypothetical protein